MINKDLFVKLYGILHINNIYNISLMNKYFYIFYKNNINYIGILKLKTLGFKKFNKNHDNFNIYNKIMNIKDYGQFLIQKNKVL